MKVMPAWSYTPRRAHSLPAAAGILALCGLLVFGLAGAPSARQLSAPFSMAHRHPAIDYSRRPTRDAVAELDRKVQSGEVTLKADGRSVFLRSVLEALHVPVESQVMVLSKTSLQADRIGPQNPRAIYFTDTVSVGWVRGGDVLEFAAQDPEQGTVFYMLSQKPDAPLRFVRNESCLSCHVTTATREVPGMLAGSIYPGPDGLALYAPVFETTHNSPFEERWGGWYVTGRHGTMRHMGNGVVAAGADFRTLVADRNQNVDTLAGRVDLDGYLSPHSDLVALMVLEHQMHLANLLTRMAWEARVSTPEARKLVEDADVSTPSDAQFIPATRPTRGSLAKLPIQPVESAAAEVVDYMLFVDEARLTSPVSGSTGFADIFQAKGPRDRKGRSLRDLDLTTRLMRYPCSYLIYSPQFDQLPGPVRDAIYRRLWAVLSGAVNEDVHRAALPLATRQAIVEILRDTRAGLPDYFVPVTR